MRSRRVLLTAVGLGAALGFAPARGGEPAETPEGTRTVVIGAPSAEEIAPGGRIPVIDIAEKRLEHVLEYLSHYGRVNIRATDQRTKELPVSVRLENVHWRDVLDYLAQVYKLVVDEKDLRRGIIYVSKPVAATFKTVAPEGEDIRDVIRVIAGQAKANIIISPEVKGTVVVDLKDVPWRDALDMIVRTLGFVAVDEKYGVIRITQADKLKLETQTRVFRLRYIDPQGQRYTAQIKTQFAERQESGSGGAAGAAGAEGSGLSLIDVLKKVSTNPDGVTYHKDTGSLIVQDTISKLEAIQRIIDALDVPPKQVHLATRLIEMTTSDYAEFGTRWSNGFTFEGSGMMFEAPLPFYPSSGRNALRRTVPGRMGAAADDSPFTRLGDSAAAFTSTGTQLGRMDFTKLAFALQFVREQTTARIIQAPQITVLDNMEATIHVGKTIRYAEFKTETTQGGGVVSGFQKADEDILEGIQLLVIPRVTGPDNNVILTIIPKTETLDEFRTFGEGSTTPIQLPQTSDRIVVTKMLLRNQETGVIAGLKSSSFQETVTKVPFFGDIPVLGWLFKRRSRPKENNEERNLLIFVTPTVIDFLQQTEFQKALERTRRSFAEPFIMFDDEEDAAP